MKELLLVDIDPKRDGELAAGWINAPGGAQMLQLKVNILLYSKYHIPSQA